MPEWTIVTSALPYINGIKHLGNLVGSLLPADIYSRHLRMKGAPVVFICGTDEHGAPAEIAAAAEGLSPREYCDRMFALQLATYEGFSISFDYFGRSSSPGNHTLTQHIFRRLYETGHILEGTTVQLYDLEARRFLPDRYVVGTCPYCGYDSARGDQCDNCTRLLDAVQLISPRSTISGGANIERREAKQLLLKLGDFETGLAEWIESKVDVWPTTSISIARKWLKEGLKDRSITRDLEWGIRVPLPGFEHQVFYVWFDAPNGYISMTEEWAVERGQPGQGLALWSDPSSKIVQFMAKDNVPFHTIIWPAMMMGVGEYQLATIVKGFEYLNYEGGKFSTSRNRGVFLDDALKEFPSDYWRYYLITIVPERSDSDFTWGGLQKAIDNLADTLGNFVNRTLSFINKYTEGIVPDAGEAAAGEWLEPFASHLAQCETALDELNYNAWIRALRALWTEGNRFIDAQQPWTKRKSDPEEMRVALAQSAHLIYLFARASAPLLPDASREIIRQLGLEPDGDHWTWPRAPFAVPFAPGHKISSEVRPLFQKIPDERVAELIARYSGVPAADPA